MQLTLKRRRMLLGITGREMARQLGISAAYLSQLESGVRSRPSDELLGSAATILECTVDELTGRTPTEPLRASASPRENESTLKESSPPYACRIPSDCDVAARFGELETTILQLKAQIDTLTQLLGASLRKPGEAPEKKRAG